MVQVLLQGPAAFTASRVLPYLSWNSFCTSWKRVPLQEILDTLHSYLLVVKTEAQREVGAGGRQIQSVRWLMAASTLVE